MYFWHNRPLYKETEVFLIETLTNTLNERAAKTAVHVQDWFL